MRFKKPDPSLLATRVDESGAPFWFNWTGITESASLSRRNIWRWTPRQANDEDSMRPSQPWETALVCFTRNEGLTFLTVKEENKSW